MAAHHHVLQGGHLGEQTNILKSARDTGFGHFMHRRRLVRLASQGKATAVGCVQARQDVEKSGLARAVGTDQAIHLTALDADTHIAEGLKPTEALGNTGHLKYCVCHGALSSALGVLQGLAVVRRGPQATRPQQHHADHRQRDQQLAQNRRIEPATAHGLQRPGHVTQHLRQG